ncbi:hypothetical protein HYU09_00570 [Candidatus Woesearchaeota archaeon]|nr:hypothetical protein [Candidatus Woesearchaeota archaeon]
MANNGLLAGIDKKSANEFRKDLLGMLRVGKELEKYYAESNQDFDAYLKKFSSLVDSFNRKYKGLKLKLEKKTESLELNILIDEKSVKDSFANSGSKIIGLQSIGANGFGAATVSDPEGLSAELEKTRGRIYISYFNPNTGTSNVFLQLDKKSKKVQLVYDADIENEPSAEFQIAAYYALSHGYNKKIKISEEAATLGFSSWPDHNVKSDYYRKFDTYLTE